MWVTFSLSEAEALRYRDEVERGLLKRPVGDAYTVEIVLADGSIFPEIGRITFADPAYNSQTGTFTVRVQLANPQGLLRPNQFVRARLKGAIRPNALAVPLRAVQQGPKGHFVWVVGKEGTVEMRPVTVGSWIGEEWQITNGLQPGAVVVVDGALALAPGAAVKTQPLAVPTPMAVASAVKPDVKPPPASATASALPARVYFASGSAALDANAKESLRSIGNGLIGNGLIGAPYPIEITGYVDSKGAAAKSRVLAEQRAKAVRDALVAAGVKADRIRLSPPANIVGGSEHEQARRVDIAFAVR
jgi:membrane fusion protein (multidrug efflux system)